MNILIAEDDLISRKLLQTNLEQMGYQVTASTDGQGGLGYIRPRSLPNCRE